jgi:hypothetical protein
MTLRAGATKAAGTPTGRGTGGGDPPGRHLKIKLDRA